ncbi:MAG TPA: hypothetical protein VMH00_05580 [Candidatus Limnocylindrales bacterium]|nr:hypothetical protein [Candidatus Limnocylindrales bacterium]
MQARLDAAAQPLVSGRPVTPLPELLAEPEHRRQEPGELARERQPA